MTASGSSDADGDAITYDYKFYNDDDTATRQDWSPTNSYVIQVVDAHDTIRIITRATTSDANSTATYNETDAVDNTVPQVTLTAPTDGDHDNDAQQNYTFSYSDGDSDTSNCTLYINASNEGYNESCSGTTTIEGSSTLSDSTYQWYVSCNDGNGGTNQTGNFTYVVDTVNPNIDWYLPAPDNSTIVEKNFQSLLTNISIDDTYLSELRARIFYPNGTLFWQYNRTALVTALEELTNITSFAAELDGTYEMRVEATDDHTAKQIPAYAVDKGDKYLRFVTDSGTEITISEATKQGNPLKRVDTEKLLDRYTFDFEFNNPRKQVSFYVESSEKIYYRGNLYPFPVFVTGKHWVDFDVTDLKSSTVTKVSDYKALVTLEVNSDKNNFKFNSLGGLNTVNETNTFLVRTNDAPTIADINITPTTAYENSTLTCNVATADDESDAVNLAYLWYINNMLQAGATAATFDCDAYSCNRSNNVTCEVTPSDTWQTGTAQNTSITISNFAPVITVSSLANVWVIDTALSVNNTWDYDFGATDIDASDTLTWYDNTTLFAIDPTTGTINFTGAEANVGAYTILINVSDGTANDTLTFNLTVLNSTLEAVIKSVSDPYVLGTNISAYRILNVTNPSGLWAATGVQYNFSSLAGWQLNGSEDHNFDLAASADVDLRTNFTIMPGNETSWTAVYSTGVAVDGYQEYIYTVYVNMTSTTNETENVTVRYAIPLARLPASYNDRNIYRDDGEVNDSTTGVSTANSQYIDANITYYTTISPGFGTWKWEYMYYVFAGASGGGGGGGGGGDDTVPFAIVSDECSLRLQTTAYTFTPDERSHEIWVENIGNISISPPTVLWVDVKNYAYSAKGKFEVLESAQTLPPKGADNYILRFTDAFGNNTEKVIFRITDGTDECYVDALLTVQPIERFELSFEALAGWLTEEIGAIPFPGTDWKFHLQNWLPILLFALIALAISIFVVEANFVARSLLFTIIFGGLTAAYAIALRYLVG